MAPSMVFLGQPFSDGPSLGAKLQEALRDERVGALTLAVAWARFGALARLEAPIAEFQARGGTLRIVLGIDEGAATRPGLLKALRVADDAYVLHDPSGRTFHPKLYLAEGPTIAHLFVGSGNLTPGGLYFNYEAAVEITFALPEEVNAPALVATRQYIENLLSDTAICLPLSEALIQRLVEDPRYPIATTERRISRTMPEQPPEGAEDDEVDSVVEEGATTSAPAAPIFGSSALPKAPVPNLGPLARAELSALEGETPDEPPDDAEAPLPPLPGETIPTVALEWSKIISAADAQKPQRAGTNPTGVLRLNKAGHDINHRTWFREQLFAAAPWQPSTDRHGNLIEIASVPMGVTIEAQSFGTATMQVDHAPHREAGQNNVPTILHWGETVGNLLRSGDYRGYRVLLRSTPDGRFSLTIRESEAPG